MNFCIQPIVIESVSMHAVYTQTIKEHSTSNHRPRHARRLPLGGTSFFFALPYLSI